MEFDIERQILIDSNNQDWEIQIFVSIFGLNKIRFHWTPTHLLTLEDSFSYLVKCDIYLGLSSKHPNFTIIMGLGQGPGTK